MYTTDRVLLLTSKVNAWMEQTRRCAMGGFFFTPNTVSLQDGIGFLTPSVDESWWARVGRRRCLRAGRMSASEAGGEDAPQDTPNGARFRRRAVPRSPGDPPGRTAVVESAVHLGVDDGEVPLLPPAKPPPGSLQMVRPTVASSYSAAAAPSLAGRERGASVGSSWRQTGQELRSWSHGRMQSWW
jgi:hypothetical protein